jgi:hypothetical protein
MCSTGFDAFRAIVIFCRYSQIGVSQEVASDPDLVRHCNSPCGRSSIADVMERDRSTSMRPTSSQSGEHSTPRFVPSYDLVPEKIDCIRHGASWPVRCWTFALP